MAITTDALSTSNKYIKYQITVTQGAFNVENNTSEVTISVKFYRTNTGYETWGNGRVYVEMDGDQSYQTVTPSQKITNSGIVLFKQTIANVKHEDDGSKTLAVFAWIDHEEVTSNKQGAYFVLNPVPRASQPSCITWPEHTQNVGYFGDTIAIHMNRKSSDFLHTVFYHWGGSGPVIGTNVQNSIQWTIPMSLMDKIPNATEGSGIIYVNTYQNGKDIGQKYCGFTVKVPSSVKPTCSLQVLDATGTKDKYGNLVQGLSKLYIKTTAAGAYSSTIKNYVITADGKSYDKAELTTEPLTTPGTVTVNAYVKDSRGRNSTTASASFPVLAYVKPAITELSVHRCDADGTENDQGEFVQITFSAAITPLNNKNSATYTLRYKKSSDTSYTPVALSALAGKYTVTDYSYIIPADSDYTYDIEVEAKDDTGPITRATSASTGYTFMDWNDDGKSIAFGKVSEESGAFENTLNFKQLNNQYCFGTNADNVMGYVAMAQIEITSVYANAPLKFELSHRSAHQTMTVHVRFYNENNLDPPLHSITYEGDNFQAFLVNTAPSIWVLYVGKQYNNDWITLNRWTAPTFMNNRVKITFPGDVVNEVPQGLRGFYRATPAKLQSLLDFIYPVGSVYISYSHVSPAELFGGTWVRIENAFLWGTTASGIIGQTGGESEHTLTVDEMPSHRHTGYGMYATPGSGTGVMTGTDKPGSSQSGDKQTNYTGGGKAHNNMPPYIQVSIWRRTA